MLVPAPFPPVSQALNMMGGYHFPAIRCQRPFIKHLSRPSFGVSGPNQLSWLALDQV